MPESHAKCSLFDGLLVEEPSATEEHQCISLNLTMLLAPEVKRRELGVVRYAPCDVWLSEDIVVQPDVLFISRERAHVVKGKWIHGAPDLVVEILSPSTARLDRGRKRQLYAEGGVRELWLIDPRLRRIEVFQFDVSSKEAVKTAGIGETLASPLLPGMSLEVSKVFEL